MCNHGQQQYFSDVIKLSVQTENIFYFFVNDYHVDQQSKLDEFESYHFILQDEYLHLKGIDLALHTEIYCRSPHIQNRCFIGHGFSGKHTSWGLENIESFNHYFLYGPRDREIFSHVTKEYPKSTIDKIKLWDVGYPKYDLNFKNYDSQIEEIRKSIGLEPSKKTILFAPAWDPKGVLRTHGLKLLNLFENLKEYNFIIKLHPATLASKKSRQYDFYTGGLDWRKEIKDFMDKSKSNNLFFPVIESINPLFKISDLLITDFSGVSLGFCLEDKPIICLDCHDFQETLSKWGSDPNQSFENNLFNNGREAATIVKNLEELYNAVKIVFSKPEEKAQEREQIRSKLLYNRGQGATSFLKVMNLLLQN